MILITQNDFTERTGVDLSADVREDGITSDRQATALIERWERYVYKTASRFPNIINSDKLNAEQIEDIKNAVCSYGLACVLKGDLETLGGVDLDIATSGIIDTLRQHGIIRNGFKGTSGFHGRWY